VEYIDDDVRECPAICHEICQFVASCLGRMQYTVALELRVDGVRLPRSS